MLTHTVWTHPISRLYTIHAPGIGRVIGAIGSRKEMQTRIADRKANGEGYPRERVSEMRLLLRWDGRTLHATDLGGA